MNSKEGGIKHDAGKPDLSMISLELVEELARVREFGAKKYSRSNWKRGFKVTRSCAAALRHIFQFLAGHTYDSESGLCHVAHAVACLEHCLYDMRHHPENDDRDKPAPSAVTSPPTFKMSVHTQAKNVPGVAEPMSHADRAAKGRAP